MKRLNKILTGFALLFACILPSLAAWVYFVALRGQDSVRLAYSLSKVIQFAFPLVWVLLVERTRPMPSLPTGRGILPGLIFGLAVGMAMVGIYFFKLKHGSQLADTPARLWAKLSEAGIDTPGKFIALGAFVALAHSLLEEYYWRWFVYGRMRSLMPTWPAAALSGIAFAAHHVILIASYLKPDQFWTGAIFLSFCVAVGGMVWALIYERSGSLYGGWLSHAIVDVALVIIGYDLCQGYFTT